MAATPPRGIPSACSRCTTTASIQKRQVIGRA
jgi:hypothetical protein